MRPRTRFAPTDAGSASPRTEPAVSSASSRRGCVGSFMLRRVRPRGSGAAPSVLTTRDPETSDRSRSGSGMRKGVAGPRALLGPTSGGRGTLPTLQRNRRTPPMLIISGRPPPTPISAVKAPPSNP